MPCQNCGYRGLSQRELQIEELIVQGISRKETAHRLGIAEKTVSVHMLRLFRKREVTTAVQLTRAWFLRKYEGQAA